MNPCHYLDFTIGPEPPEGDDRSPGQAAAELPTPVVAGAALKVLHGVFRDTPGRYALALPRHGRQPFAVLRVFAGERDHLDALVAAVESHPVIRDYVRLGYPRRVPPDFAGTWTEFRRFRIPARRSGRKPGDDLRQRRMAQAAEARLLYFILHSRSTGQQFGLYVDIRAGGPNAGEAEPDSYGLAVATRPFALPDLP
jgi:hypothetical protein